MFAFRALLKERLKEMKGSLRGRKTHEILTRRIIRIIEEWPQREIPVTDETWICGSAGDVAPALQMLERFDVHIGPADYCLCGDGVRRVKISWKLSYNGER